MRNTTRWWIPWFLSLLVLGAVPWVAYSTPRDELADMAIESRKPVIADFGLGFCAQCRKQSATLDEIRETYGDKVVVRMVNVGREHRLTERYEVKRIPTLVFFDAEGKVVLKKVGPMGFDAIRDQLSRMGVK